MKLKPNIFNQLNQEPFEKQDIDGTQVELHYMEDASILKQYADKGTFALWTSDGKNYKILIEKTYHEVMKNYYQADVNKIWLQFFNRAEEIRKKSLYYFFIPIIALYAVFITVGLFAAPSLFNDNMLQFALGFLIVFFIGNMISGSITNKKYAVEKRIVQDSIFEYFGEHEYEKLVLTIDDHYKEYFKVDESTIEESEDNIEEDRQEDESEGN